MSNHNEIQETLRGFSFSKPLENISNKDDSKTYNSLHSSFFSYPSPTNDPTSTYLLHNKYTANLIPQMDRTSCAIATGKMFFGSHTNTIPPPEIFDPARQPSLGGRAYLYDIAKILSQQMGENIHHVAPFATNLSESQLNFSKQIGINKLHQNGTWIAHLKAEGEEYGHAVAVNFHDQQIILRDPSPIGKGSVKTMPLKEFLSLWTGEAYYLYHPEEFRSSNESPQGL